MRVLLVDQHDAANRATASHLTACGFVIDSVATLAAARAALLDNRYDGMILDTVLPDGEGGALLTASQAPPTLIVTARERLEDRVLGLNAGADDYLVKPVDLPELEARLRAVLRRPGRRTPVLFTLGRIRFNTTTRQVLVSDSPLALGRRDLLLLEALLIAAHRIVPREVLIERIYGFDENATSNALEAAAYRLRRALDKADARVVLETRRNIGYTLRASPPRSEP